MYLGKKKHRRENGKDVLLLLISRVHISESTLLNLGNEYEVEEAHGHERDAYIAKLGIKTYFIVPREGAATQNPMMMK